MAGGAIVNTGGGKDYPGKLTLFVLLTCVVVAAGGLIFGYDIVISGGVTSMDPFLKKFFPEVFWKKQEAKTNQFCKYDNQLLQTFTSSLYLAALVASFFTATVTRVLGRKWSMLVGGLTFLVGAALNGAAQNVAMLIIGRILLGIGVGFANQSSKTDDPTGKLNFKFWQEAGAVKCVQSHIKLMIFRDFRGEWAELSFLKFFLETAQLLINLVIVFGKGSFTSMTEASSKVKPLFAAKWASQSCSLQLVESALKEGEDKWFQDFAT